MKKRGRAQESSPSPSPLVLEAHAAKKRVLLDAAAGVLARHGPEGFNVRAVAKAVGASTMVVYSLFGGREELLAAICRDGLDRLAIAFGEAAKEPSLALLGDLAMAYRRFAMANREYYYALAAVPGASGFVRGSRPYGVLLDAVRGCIESGELARRDPEDVTDGLWGLVHGMVSLELGGYFPSASVAEERLFSAGAAMLQGLRQIRRPSRRAP